MAQLPLKLPQDQLQSRWKSILDPLLANNMNSISVLSDVPLNSGVNVINHLLGKVQQGWVLVDKQGVADIYRSQPFNATTLTLTSSASVVVSIGVF